MESGAGPAEEIGYAFGNALMILDALRPPSASKTSRRPSNGFRSSSTAVSNWSRKSVRFAPTSACGATSAVTNTEIEGVAFRAGCQVRSLTLTEQQPELNIIRIAYEALPVVLSAHARVNALQLPGFREAMALPDQAEQLMGLRTQQVLMHETGHRPLR